MTCTITLQSTKPELAWFCRETCSGQKHAKFPEKLHNALDEDSSCVVIAFYTDFTKAFD